VTALSQIFGEGYHADKVLERVLKSNKQFGARDRKLIAESVYEITRWWRYLWAVVGQEPTADTYEMWKVFGTWLVLNTKEGAPPWKEFSSINRNTIPKRAEEAKKNPALLASVPDWLYERGQTEIGKQWAEYLAALNEQAPVILRANRLRTNKESLANLLSQEGVNVDLLSLPDGLKLRERKNIFGTDAFQKGLFEVQDGASQQVAPMLDPQPGERVIDACAGAGGKSLHLAALMKNKGKILSLDIYDKKLEELRKRASRAGAEIIETRAIDSTKVIKRLEGTADRLLLDVPCSGLGVLRRNPDKKWKLSNEEIERLRTIQMQILESYAKMVKPGGRMVYATCSILPSENERQVEEFLKKTGDTFELLEERKFAPGKDGFDGFYAASLKKKN
jgi:16S rRNA (cytosine967-C5)-methyltransferase